MVRQPRRWKDRLYTYTVQLIGWQYRMAAFIFSGILQFSIVSWFLSKNHQRLFLVGFRLIEKKKNKLNSDNNFVLIDLVATDCDKFK